MTTSPAGPAPVTDEEFRTHVYPVAEENWHDAHGIRLGERDLTDAEWAEIAEWAVIYREAYSDGSFAITWRDGRG